MSTGKHTAVEVNPKTQLSETTVDTYKVCSGMVAPGGGGGKALGASRSMTWGGAARSTMAGAARFVMA